MIDLGDKAVVIFLLLWRNDAFSSKDEEILRSAALPHSSRLQRKPGDTLLLRMFQPKPQLALRLLHALSRP